MRQRQTAENFNQYHWQVSRRNSAIHHDCRGSQSAEEIQVAIVVSAVSGQGHQHSIMRTPASRNLDDELGLTIARAMVELNLGSLSIDRDESTPRFVVQIPCRLGFDHEKLPARIEASKREVPFVSLFRVAPEEFNTLEYRMLEEIDDFLSGIMSTTLIYCYAKMTGSGWCFELYRGSVSR